MGLNLRVADVRSVMRRAVILASAGVFVAFAGSLIAASSTETAVANGDTRTLHLYHTHTGESIDATFRVDGRYDPSVLRQLNHFLRDWRNNDEINMDPRLFDTLWEVYRTAGANEPIQIYSAYRSPETNAMLRRRSRAVAEHSQHMLGKAMDTTIPGFPMHLIREVGMRLQRGGVGWYPSANFVHLDVGSVRSWPRMSYDQLAGLFPDGKTVHIASNGQVLPGYDAARAEIAARGGTEIPPAQESQGFFAWLFGGGSGGGAAPEDEEDRRVAVAAPVQQAPQPAPRVDRTALAYADREIHDSAPQETRAPIDSEQLGVQDAPRPPERSQIAKLEAPSTDEANADVRGASPMPPRRPIDLAALIPEIPLPPIRPNALMPLSEGSVHFVEATQTRKDSIGRLITSSSVAVLRKPELPAIITQGNRARAPSDALAYAEPSANDGMLALHSAPMPMARPAMPRPIGLRSAMRDQPRHAVTATTPMHLAGAAAKGAVGVGPQLTGLRRAAKLMSDKASL